MACSGIASTLMVVAALMPLHTFAAAAPRVVAYDFQKVSRPVRRLRKRAGDPVNVQLFNDAQNMYQINITLGSPGQDLIVQLDTGSSDLWIPSSDSSLCKQNPAGCKEFGSFDLQSSTSAKDTSNPDESQFQISYGDGSEFSGQYYIDTLQMGGVTIDNAEFALVTDVLNDIVDESGLPSTTGVFGVSFPNGQATVSQDEEPQYKGILQSMKTAQIIDTIAYSLWLNDPYAKSGTILFGGVDTDKYEGDLISAPLVPQAGQREIDAMNVELTSIGLTDGSKTTSLDTNVRLAILDSGTSLIVMPIALADMFVKEMGGVTIRGSSYVACNVESATATFDFQFAGSNGPKVSVPVSEMVLPQLENETFDDGTPACGVGITAQDQDFLVLGDVFLRSTYVVYNLESRTVALAKAKVNVTTSNIKAINSDIPGLSGPGGTSLPYSASATPSATDILGPLFGSQSLGFAATSAISVVPGKPSFSVGGGGNGGGSGGGKKNEGAHVYGSPVLPMSYVVVSLVTVMGMMVGGAVIHRL